MRGVVLVQLSCILQTGAALQGPLRRIAPTVSVTDRPLPVDTPRGDIVLGTEPAVAVEEAVEAAPASYARGLATIGGITGANPAKTLLAAGIGLALGTVGIDPQSAVPRYTFGSFHLYDGFHAIVAIVGLFAISEALILLEHGIGASEMANRPTMATMAWKPS